MEKILFCKKCPNLVQSRNQVVPGYGDFNSRLMFVGMAPGRNGADITGIPFTRDPSGVLFQECLIRAGFSLEDNPKTEKPLIKNVFITNLVKCNPKGENGLNRTPSKKEIKNCSIYFSREVKKINPNLIVPLGKIVTEYILKIKIDKFLIYHNRPVLFEKRIILPFIHPSYVIRGAYDRREYIDEFVNLRRYLE